MKQCRVCCEAIRPKAIKCTKCGSYQDWTRHLLRWSALLVSLFALAPLWSISDSLSKLAFTKKSAKLEAAVTACDHQEVRVAFENSGELSAIVTSVAFTIDINGKRQLPEVSIRNNQADGDILVVPHEPPVMISYRAYIEDEATNFLPAQQIELGCTDRLDIEWTDLQGGKQHLFRECGCQ